MTKYKIYKITATLLLFVFVFSIVSCKTHRDCRGRKKTAKTSMGGWI